ncbi:glycosyltransferase family 4 protein [Bacteroides clarus]|uniref:Glycosyl transferase family 1 domain-containing protein n=1 Tax=Bacteroides clarus TaxID=626929 RepID=A0A1Y3Z021_9BACE|nr:glycosyltransferase family 4 protein [Bacteroides clarus]OUN99900.1 hypothetical protein B5F97_15030 [Bacteroides clarus]
MNILWITNILFPDICKEIGRKIPVTGGWMKSLAEALTTTYPDVNLSVAALYGDKKNTLLKKKIKNITYYCLPFYEFETAYNPNMETVWKEVHAQCNPDVVHIHGTEYPYGLAYLRANGVKHVVVSLQGLVSVYARYSLGQIPNQTLQHYRTFYDYIKGNILKTPEIMEKQGKLEIEYISTVKHVIGRTEWDKAHVWAINSQCKYHFCNEILRSPFYEEQYQWSLQACEQHSIFLSQAYKPIKGIHKVIEALPIILHHYPNTKVYVAGNNFMNTTELRDKLKFSTYANYIKHLIEQKNITNCFHFTGVLNERQMAERYRSAHVFICPSSIENSPNSLGEAQILGVPCIASYVGGVPDMIQHGQTGLLYRFEEYEMLAAAVCRIFEDNELATHISKTEKKEAALRHNKQINAANTYQIYKDIINEI